MLHWTLTLVFCGFVPCCIACVDVRPCMTLYHGDLVSSDSGVQAMFSQMVVHPACGYLARIRINEKFRPKSQRGVGPYSGGRECTELSLRKAERRQR